MDTAILNTPIQVLDQILALNLDVTLWTARTKLTAEDFGGVALPPDELAYLGSKKIYDTAKLQVFNRLKVRAFSLLDKHGIRFLSGWAIPEDKAGDIIKTLCAIRDDFYAAKAEFLASYEEGITDWIDRHPTWASIISGSTVSKDYVEKRLSFSWQLYRVAPAVGLTDEEAMTESGLIPEIENLGSTLFTEISNDASDIWRKVFEGKTEVTHKALSPLKTMRNKLNGLSFVEPHVVPVIDLIETALSKIPARGIITGASLLMLQGVVSLLKDKAALISQASAMMMSPAEETMNDFFDAFEPDTPTLNLEPETEEGNSMPLYPMAATVDSLGLW